MSSLAPLISKDLFEGLPTSPIEILGEIVEQVLEASSGILEIKQKTWTEGIDRFSRLSWPESDDEVFWVKFRSSQYPVEEGYKTIDGYKVVWVTTATHLTEEEFRERIKSFVTGPEFREDLRGRFVEARAKLL